MELGLLEGEATAKDGNCMFHALSFQLKRVFGKVVNHEEVRRLVVQYLRQNPHVPGQGGQHFREFIAGNDWDGYLKQLADNEWGDHIALHAAANVFGITAVFI